MNNQITQINVRLDEELKTLFEKGAQADNRSLNSFLIVAGKKYSQEVLRDEVL